MRHTRSQQPLLYLYRQKLPFANECDLSRQPAIDLNAGEFKVLVANPKKHLKDLIY